MSVREFLGMHGCLLAICVAILVVDLAGGWVLGSRWAAPVFIAVSNLVYAAFALLRVTQSGAYGATDHIKNQLVFDFRSSCQKHMQYRIAWLRARVIAARDQHELAHTTQDRPVPRCHLMCVCVSRQREHVPRRSRSAAASLALQFVCSGWLGRVRLEQEGGPTPDAHDRHHRRDSGDDCCNLPAAIDEQHFQASEEEAQILSDGPSPLVLAF